MVEFDRNGLVVDTVLCHRARAIYVLLSINHTKVKILKSIARSGKFFCRKHCERFKFSERRRLQTLGYNESVKIF